MFFLTNAFCCISFRNIEEHKNVRGSISTSLSTIQGYFWLMAKDNLSVKTQFLHLELSISTIYTVEYFLETQISPLGGTGINPGSIYFNYSIAFCDYYEEKKKKQMPNPFLNAICPQGIPHKNTKDQLLQDHKHLPE